LLSNFSHLASLISHLASRIPVYSLPLSDFSAFLCFFRIPNPESRIRLYSLPSSTFLESRIPIPASERHAFNNTL
jgi:hypothetical protein